MRLRLGEFDYQNIYEDIESAEKIAQGLIVEIGLKTPYTQKDLVLKIYEELKKMNVSIIINTNEDGVMEKAGVNGTIIKNSQEKKTFIGIRAIDSKRTKIEKIVHEFVHLKLTQKVPLFTTAIDDSYTNYIFSKEDLLYGVENPINMITMLMLVPREQLQKDLTETCFDVEQVLSKYCNCNIGTVLSVIAITSGFPCHYTKILFKTVDIDARPKIIDEFCSDTVKLDFDNIIYDQNSKAYESKKSRTSKTGLSKLENGKEYFCYSFYQNDITDMFDCETHQEHIVYDVLHIFGWQKFIHNVIKNYFAKNTT